MAWLKWRGSEGRGRWYGSWSETVSGKRRKVWKALSRDKKTAERMLREIERNIDLRGAGLAQPIEWRQFREEYLKHMTSTGKAASTLVRIKIIFKHLEDFCPITNLMQLTPKLLDDYKGDRKSKGIEPATVNREISAIKAAIKRARRWQFQAHDLDPVDKLPVIDKPRECFTNADIQVMLANADPMFRIIILLGLYAGLRREEMLQLRWSDIKWTDKLMVLGSGWKTKTNTVRHQPIPPTLEVALARWKEVCPAESERVIQWNHQPHQLSGMFTHFLRKRCGIAKGCLHALRHTFITALAQKDVIGSKVQKLAGHKSGRTTEIYTHLRVADVWEAVNRLDYTTAQRDSSNEGSK